MKRNTVYRWIPAFAGMTLALLFSFFLMFHTFSYDGNARSMRIASKAWSDFGAHIPLIRSFSMGPNLSRLVHARPIESPLYPGEPIRYHFGFYALAGILEKLGVRIDWALNIPSALGFAALLIGIYWLSFLLFRNAFVSALSVILFLCNGSLTFLRYFSEHTINRTTLFDIITNAKFTSFGPWDGGTISAFWTLNIYTNQRHLGISYALILLMLIVLLTTKTHRPRHAGILIGILGSTLIFFNFAAIGIAGICCGWMFMTDRKSRIPLLTSLVLLVPSLALLKFLTAGVSPIAWQPGYLVQSPLTLPSWLNYWWENLGLATALIPLGLIFAPPAVRKSVGPPLLLIFLLPNLFRFSPDMINNHKFFNFALIIGNMFAAYAVIRITKLFHAIPILLIRIPLQVLCGMLLVGILTLSGVIDFFPVINDYKGSIADVPVNPDARYILLHTAPSDIIANSTWFYHPASIAGRSLLSGYTYFTWSYGYDQAAREASLKAIYEAPNISALCTQLRASRVTLIELNINPESYLRPNLRLWDSLAPAYENPETHRRLYESGVICGQPFHASL